MNKAHHLYTFIGMDEVIVFLKMNDSFYSSGANLFLYNAKKRFSMYNVYGLCPQTTFHH